MRINRAFLQFCRTIHIYLTMMGLGVMLLFGITGFTVNHEEWFGATRARVTETTGQTPAELISKNDPLRIVEHLRTTFRISGAMTAFDDLTDRFSIGFKEPGRIWEIEIVKATGVTSVHHEAFNFAAVINNLHRGRYSGTAWRWVIDISAALIVLACATGVVLWLSLPHRRKLGIAVFVIGTAGTLLIYYLLVPGADTELPPPKAPTPQLSPATVK